MPLLLGILPRSVPTRQNSVTWPYQDAARKAVFVAVSQLISGKHVEEKNGYWKVTW